MNKRINTRIRTPRVSTQKRNHQIYVFTYVYVFSVLKEKLEKYSGDSSAISKNQSLFNRHTNLGRIIFLGFWHVFKLKAPDCLALDVSCARLPLGDRQYS